MLDIKDLTTVLIGSRWHVGLLYAHRPFGLQGALRLSTRALVGRCRSRDESQLCPLYPGFSQLSRHQVSRPDFIPPRAAHRVSSPITIYEHLLNCVLLFQSTSILSYWWTRSPISRWQIQPRIRRNVPHARDTLPSQWPPTRALWNRWDGHLARSRLRTTASKAGKQGY